MEGNLEVKGLGHLCVPELVLIIPQCYHDNIPVCDSNGIVVLVNIICAVVDVKYLRLDDYVCIGESDGILLLGSEAALITIIV